MATTKRIPLVGVIGGDDQTGVARLVGRELMKNGCALLTGGSAINGQTATKCQAILGTLDAEQHREGLARYIGVLPNFTDGNDYFEKVSPRQVLIHSSLSSMNRNPINGITPDVLICFAGGPGTICELAFGIIAGRQAVFNDNSAEILLDKCTKAGRREIKRNMLRVVSNWKSHLPVLIDSGNRIMGIVTNYLSEAVSRRRLLTPQEVVQAALQSLPIRLSDIPAFPGIPRGLLCQHIDTFSSCWNILSQDSAQSSILLSSSEQSR